MNGEVGSYKAPDPNFQREIKERILGMPAARFFGFRFGKVEPGLAQIVTRVEVHVDADGRRSLRTALQQSIMRAPRAREAS